MKTFRAATDCMLTDQIGDAKNRIVFLAPGVSEAVAKALVRASDTVPSVTVVLDADEKVCHVGYGDVEGFHYLAENPGTINLCSQRGLRLGLLVTDHTVTIWSPTPRSVDDDRKQDQQPNAIVLFGGGSGGSGDGELTDELSKHLRDEGIGQASIRPEELKKVVEELEDNPPTPFDLSRKVKVFSTKFQYVEAKLQGVEWSERRISVSNLLLNADLPENLRRLLDTQVRPYGATRNIKFKVPCILQGQIAYNQSGEKILIPTTQDDIIRTWKDIKEKYLFAIPRFGTLVRRRDKTAFCKEVEAFKCVLEAWVVEFKRHVKKDDDELVDEIVKSIKARIGYSGRRKDFVGINLDADVRDGLDRMRQFSPDVHVVFKDVSWESTRDEEFTTALREALPPEDLEGWFEEFTAAQEQQSST